MVDSTMTGTGGSLVSRMVRAARLDPAVYEEVEADRTATGQAATAVAIVAVAGGIGAALAQTLFRPEGVPGVNPILALVGGIVGALLGWLIWSYVTYFVGTRFFGGTATPGELLRTIGFAQAPGVLNILAFIPVVGGLIGIITLIWSLVAGIIAVRQALDFDTGKAILTTVIGWIFLLIVFFVLALLFGGALFGLGAMSGAGAPSY
jgi:hypothetical protein